ncbi:MAG: amino acid ABC transporter permease [Chloroflexi bacterium]|jgi:polar amino acid transport system permease protein|nr:MAG: amino acid ABC transporter permease [Chloroflexota bacterium]RLT28957.1 MAG: amino acid ABC transporter permease [Chloroflexota bacterium]
MTAARSARRGLLVAVVSTVAVAALVVTAIGSSAAWPIVQQAFFSARYFGEAFPRVLGAFLVNVQLFVLAEILILPLGLLIALARSAPGPALAPLRLAATAYVDFFRGVPSILVIYALGFGIPALQLPGVPKEPFFWALVTLTLIYSAYVSEVYRAGIESIHPSQERAARALGLSRVQALRYVVIPQAFRRVIPPLLNDFIGLQKDTALVSILGVVDTFRQAQILKSANFNFTPLAATALIFLVITLPMTRIVDRLAARDRAAQQAEGR